MGDQDEAGLRSGLQGERGELAPLLLLRVSEMKVNLVSNIKMLREILEVVDEIDEQEAQQLALKGNKWGSQQKNCLWNRRITATFSTFYQSGIQKHPGIVFNVSLGSCRNMYGECLKQLIPIYITDQNLVEIKESRLIAWKPIIFGTIRVKLILRLIENSREKEVCPLILAEVEKPSFPEEGNNLHESIELDILSGHRNIQMKNYISDTRSLRQIALIP